MLALKHKDKRKVSLEKYQLQKYCVHEKTGNSEAKTEQFD